MTFQARDVDESRYMFDQLAVLSPVFLALTAATPIFRGRLVDTDVRWDVIAASVDDRTPAERGEVGDGEEQQLCPSSLPRDGSWGRSSSNSSTGHKHIFFFANASPFSGHSWAGEQSPLPPVAKTLLCLSFLRGPCPS